MVTLNTADGMKEISGLPENYRNNLHNTPYYLEVEKVDGLPVIEHCDTCGHLICEGEAHTSNTNGVWCNHCLPIGN